MRVFSIASGIGGFEIAMQEYNFVAYSEIDTKAISVYEQHFSHTNFGDLTTIDYKSLPPFDLVVGGLPCQPHSIAGKKKGADDERDLFEAFNDLLRETRPKRFIIENVPNALKSVDTYPWYAMGYHIIIYKVTASDWGVPQKRKRIFFCGEYAPGLYYYGEEPEVIELKPKKPIHCPTVADIAEKEVDEKYYLSEEQLGKLHWKKGAKIVNDDIAQTLTTRNAGNQNWRGNLLREGERVRRLTPLEAERVMGLECDWTKYDKDGNELSDSERYKLIGNAVVPQVVSVVLKRLGIK